MQSVIQPQRILSWRTARLVLCLVVLVITALLLLPLLGLSTKSEMSEYAKTYQGRHFFEGGVLSSLGVAGILCMSSLRPRVAYIMLAIPIFMWFVIFGVLDIIQGIPR